MHKHVLSKLGATKCAPAGAFVPAKIHLLFSINREPPFCVLDAHKLAYWGVSYTTFLRPLRTESGVGNSLADPDYPADPDYLVHEPRLGTTLPRAPGVRMT